MPFRKYDHVERVGHEAVSGLLLGQVYIFPKLDGTNGSTWMEWAPAPFALKEPIDARLAAGSRTRELSLENDNAGFFRDMDVAKLVPLFKNFPNWRLYGEWLVPHTLKTYREDAWRKFYVFDVHNGERYVPYSAYSDVLEDMGIEFIRPLCIFTNPTVENLQHEVENNTYLIQDGAGKGEGIVAKNYDWENKWGHQPWAKLVRNEFKEDNRKAFGVTEKDGTFQVEAAIAEECVTAALVAKERAKIVVALANDDVQEGRETILPPAEDPGFAILYKSVTERHRSKIIPQLLGRVYHCVVTEELWDALKRHKSHQTINFKTLQKFCTLQTKKMAQDLF